MTSTILEIMKIEWHFRYVPEGQMEPDNHGRWAVYGYIHVHVKKGLPEKFDWLSVHGAYHPVQCCVINQSGTRGNPVMNYKFFCTVPDIMNPAAGFGPVRQMFSDDLEDLKRQVEERFEEMRAAFKYCK